MSAVFISGSSSITELPAEATTRISRMVANGMVIMVGDAPGVDYAVQCYLKSAGYRKVIVYHIGREPRNCAWADEWMLYGIDSDGHTGREAYACKDRAMARDADYGYMIWDGHSKGTKANMKEMERLGKQYAVCSK